MRPRDAAALLAKAKAMGARGVKIRMGSDGSTEIEAVFAEPEGIDAGSPADAALSGWKNAAPQTARRSRRPKEAV